MASVLLVDDTLDSVEQLCYGLKHSGYDVFTADTGHSGMTVARRVQPDFILLDLRLTDISGLEVLRSVRKTTPHSTVIMMTGYATVESCREAMKLGARDYLEKPVFIDELLAQLELLCRSASGKPAAGTVAPVDHAYVRWAEEVVAKAIRSPKDMPTLHDLARTVAHSAGAIRNWCYTANLSPRRTLKFIRGLRLMCLFRPGARLENLLDMTDRRTIARFLRLGDDTAPPCHVTMSPSDYLDAQRWIVEPAALEAVRHVLRSMEQVAGGGPGSRNGCGVFGGHGPMLVTASNECSGSGSSGRPIS